MRKRTLKKVWSVHTTIPAPEKSPSPTLACRPSSPFECWRRQCRSESWRTQTVCRLRTDMGCASGGEIIEGEGEKKWVDSGRFRWVRVSRGGWMRAGWMKKTKYEIRKKKWRQTEVTEDKLRKRRSERYGCRKSHTETILRTHRKTYLHTTRHFYKYTLNTNDSNTHAPTSDAVIASVMVSLVRA
jgi:hypothetical protein